ncbi:MAG: hypothetical protein U0841_34475, partial [Chloroflexia bacterium]
SDAEVRALVRGVPYAVYAAPAAAGRPQGAQREVSSPPSASGMPPRDAFYLIYCDERCRRASRVQVISEPPDAASRPRSTGGKPPPETASFQFGGFTWTTYDLTPESAGSVSASASLGDAYVTVHAPDRATFEQIVLGLRRIN